MTITLLPFVTTPISTWPNGFELPRSDDDDQLQPQPPVILEQWIYNVLNYSSQFGRSSSRSHDYCATQIIGPPRITEYGDNEMAWAPSRVRRPLEYLEVQVEQEVYIQSIKIHESMSGGGALTRVQLWWQQPPPPPSQHQEQTGNDTTAVVSSSSSSSSPSFVTVFEQASRCGQLPPILHIEEIHIPIEQQHIKTAFLRLEFDTRGANENDWYEIDAIQVIGITTLPPGAGGSGRSNPTLSSSSSSSKSSFSSTVLAQNIATLWMDPLTSDCTLVAVDHDTDSTDSTTSTTTNTSNPVLFPVHRGILAARCPLFRIWMENSELPLGGQKVVHGVQPVILKQILQWIYTGRIESSSSSSLSSMSEVAEGSSSASISLLYKKEEDIRWNCVALIAASDYLLLETLLQDCLHVFQRDVLSVNNAARLYVHFDSLATTMTNMKPLQQAALDYCASHFLDVSLTPEFSQLTQPQLLEVIEHYHQAYQALLQAVPAAVPPPPIQQPQQDDDDEDDEDEDDDEDTNDDEDVEEEDEDDGDDE
jgi:hypothetical protein